MTGKRLSRVRARLGAAATAAGIFYLVAVTAGSDSAAAAFAAIRAAAPAGVLRWELGDLWTQDELSGAAVLTIRESPLLLSARSEVARLWTPPAETEETHRPVEETEQSVIVPVEETPLESTAETDNGVPARTLVPSSPEGYTVSGAVYLSNSTDFDLSAVCSATEPKAAAR